MLQPITEFGIRVRGGERVQFHSSPWADAPDVGLYFVAARWSARAHEGE